MPTREESLPSVHTIAPSATPTPSVPLSPGPERGSPGSHLSDLPPAARRAAAAAADPRRPRGGHRVACQYAVAVLKCNMGTAWCWVAATPPKCPLRRGVWGDLEVSLLDGVRRVPCEATVELQAKKFKQVICAFDWRGR